MSQEKETAKTNQPAVAGDQGVTNQAQVQADLEQEVWLARQPEVFHPTIARHGRPLYSLVMQVGAINHALGVLSRQGRGNRAIRQAAEVIQKMLDDIGQGVLSRDGKTVKDFMECKEDIERIAALLAGSLTLPGDQAVSPGGIILNS